MHRRGAVGLNGRGPHKQKRAAELLAERLSANDLKIQFVRAVSALRPQAWVELFDACCNSPRWDASAFNRWEHAHSLQTTAVRGQWLPALGWSLRRGKVLPLALWSPSYHCGDCKEGHHSVGVHWDEIGGTGTRRTLERAGSVFTDVAALKRSGGRVPYRRPRAAEVAAAALVRQRLLQQSWPEIVSVLGTQGEHISEGAVRDLAHRAARTLGFEVRGRGRPGKT
jgi:hypothetical protein